VALQVAVKGGLMFYDGDDVFAYCRGGFRYASADDNVRATPVRGPGRLAGGLRVGDDLFTLDPGSCQLKSQ
jgi:hypothetical protein